jgi:nucleotide-binding universal stress UspA family protein
MKFANKVVVAVGLSSEMFEMLQPLRDMDFLSKSEIHFVHAFSTINYTSVLSDFPLIYPVQADRKAIEESVLALLAKCSHDILPKDFSGKIIKKCLFSDTPKEAFSDYVKENNADLVIVPTRQKRGFFESSFAQYVNKHTEATMIFLKQS